MIKGEIKKPPISTEEILRRTNGGFDIYQYYLGKTSRLMKCPWRKDNKPSWGVFPYNGLWMWKDHANESSGTAIQFVEKMFGLDFKKAVKKISFDFGFSQDEINTSPVKVTWKPPDIEDKEYVHISFSSRRWGKEHHAFWDKTGVNEAHCNKYEAYAVRDCAVNRKRVHIFPGEVVWAYYAPEEDRVKLYFPEREEGKWKNNTSYHYLWNYSNVQTCEKLIVIKSMKDLLVVTQLFPCCIATQAEATHIFDEDTVDRIHKLSKDVVVFYGSDDDGVKKCKEITNKHKWKYINTPKNLLSIGINDPYSLSKRCGIEELEVFMKSKKVII